MDIQDLETCLGISRRTVLQAMVAGAFTLPAMAVAAANPCRGPQPRPAGSFSYSDFGVASTAEQVTEGVDMKGMAALVTGCNSGLGLETMRVFAMRGAHVIGAARTQEKAEAACASITGHTAPVVLELSDFNSVAACAETVSGMNTPLDILVCNAGIMALPELTLSQGLEQQFVVNHLGHFLLTNSLLEQVQKSPRGRIVILSSCAHNSAPAEGIDFDNLDGSKGYNGWSAYGRSKLANGLYAAELARRLADTTVTANSVHPGVINTNLGRYLEQPAAADSDVFDKTIEQGAATQCYVAANPIPANISGQYFVDCNPAQANPKMYNADLATRLWQVSEELVSERL